MHEIEARALATVCWSRRPGGWCQKSYHLLNPQPSLRAHPPPRGCAHTWQHQNRERTEVTGKHRGAVTGLPSLRVIVLRFIQVAACARASFLLWLSNTSRRGEAVLYPFIRGVHLLANVKKHCYEHSCTSIHVDTLSLFNTYIFLEEMSMLILCPY